MIARVGTAALGCPAAQRGALRLNAVAGKRKPRRASLAWTAEGGCPYAIASVNDGLLLSVFYSES
jgi:hypothetical protein